MEWKLSLAGLLIGLLVGVTGMGGGSLMTPLLVLFFGFKPSIAIGTDIVHGAIFKSFGAVQHRRLGHVHARLAAWTLLGSAPFSIGGVSLAWWLRRAYGDGYEDTAKAILGVALVVCGIAFLVKAYLHSSPADKPFILTNRDRAIAVATGVVGGFVVGLTSVGSGTLFGLVMLVAFPLTAAKIVGTDIFHAAILLTVAGAGHLVAVSPVVPLKNMTLPSQFDLARLKRLRQLQGRAVQTIASEDAVHARVQGPARRHPLPPARRARGVAALGAARIRGRHPRPHRCRAHRGRGLLRAGVVSPQPVG